VVEILACGDGGRRPMRLVGGPCTSEKARQLIEKLPADFVPAAKAGLFLYFSCLDEAHKIAQDIPSSTGSYWHGIMHRQEPDFGNAGYWFRRVGRHEIFPSLRDAALRLWPGRFEAPEWDPFAFVHACEEAHRRPDSATVNKLEQIQLAEWQLLFDHCIREHARRSR
jgi:hypothetical protein